MYMLILSLGQSSERVGADVTWNSKPEAGTEGRSVPQVKLKGDRKF